MRCCQFVRFVALDRKAAENVEKIMQRIAVIGSIGSGKSVFSQRLSDLTGLRLYHLDRLFWAGEGAGTPGREEWLKLQKEITSGDRWIIEGNYGATIDVRLKRCDTVIYFDFGTGRSLCGYIRRVALSQMGVEKRRDVVEGCNAGFNRKLLKYVLTFNKKHREGILKGIARYPNVSTVILSSRKEADAFLNELRRAP